MQAWRNGLETISLVTGLIITAVTVAFNLFRWYSPRIRFTWFREFSKRYQAFHPRPIINAALELVWSLGAPLTALFIGWYSTQDIGIPLPDWSLVMPWIGVTLAAAIVWIGWLWGRHWIRHPEERLQLGQDPSASLPGFTVHVLCQEGYSASARAALIPLLGGYWGLWVSVFAKMAVVLALPSTRHNLRAPGTRDYVLLDWASDLICGALFILTGSIIVTSVARFILMGTAWLMVRWLPSAQKQASG